jgi:hypothetical protein
VVEELDDELLVYDLRGDHAHCLNQTAALIWRRCDGRTDRARLTAELRRRLGPSFDPALIDVGLEELARAGLLEEAGRPQSRRRFLATTIALAPAVATILAPKAAQAASCGPTGASCNRPTDCCSLMCTGPVGHQKTCR